MVEIGKVGLVFNSYGGKLAEIPDNATPFPHRAGILFKIQYSVSWAESGEEAENHFLTQARDLHTFMTPFVSSNPRQAYLNYRDVDIGTTDNGPKRYEQAKVFGAMYFKNNFDRLVKVKTAVDPDNFFRNEQSIPPLSPIRSRKHVDMDLTSRFKKTYLGRLHKPLRSRVYRKLNYPCWKRQPPTLTTTGRKPVRSLLLLQPPNGEEKRGVGVVDEREEETRLRCGSTEPPPPSHATVTGRAEEGDGEEVSVKHHRRLLCFVLLPPNPPEEREDEEAVLPMLSYRPLPLTSCVSHHRREATAGALKASSLPDVAVAFAGRKWRSVRSPVAIASGAAHCR
nr:reticuline oxidase-like protein [Ipomoea batatas]